MAKTAHASLAGAELHDVKGIEGAADGSLLTAQGGASQWSSAITPSTLSLATNVFDSYVRIVDENMNAGTDTSTSVLYLDSLRKVDNTDVTVRIWYTPALATSGNITFSVDGTQTTFSHTGTDTSLTSADLTASITENALVSIVRLGTSVDDTYVGAVNLEAVEFIYEVNTIGAATSG